MNKETPARQARNARNQAIIEDFKKSQLPTITLKVKELSERYGKAEVTIRVILCNHGIIGRYKV